MVTVPHSKFILILASLSLALSACGNSVSQQAPAEFQHGQSDVEVHHPKKIKVQDSDLEAQLDLAEQTATPSGRAIIKKAREMITDQEIVIGSCWDYINAIYDRANVPNAKRKIIFAGEKAGPFADINLIEAGDWLYFINHSYGDVEHSAIFIMWTDLEHKQALMISYPGGNQSVPARFNTYDLSSVYHIMRPELSN